MILEMLVGAFFFIVLVGLAFLVAYLIFELLPGLLDNIMELRKKIRESKNKRV